MGLILLATAILFFASITWEYIVWNATGISTAEAKRPKRPHAHKTALIKKEL